MDKRPYPDLHEHLAALQRHGLLVTIDRPIDKDSELHPLVRWQFVGGMAEADRKAFLFTNITDGSGRRYDIPVVVGAIAANPTIYSIGMGAPVAESRPNGSAPSRTPSRRVGSGRPSATKSCSKAMRWQAKATGSTGCRFRSRPPASTARRP